MYLDTNLASPAALCAMIGHNGAPPAAEPFYTNPSHRPALNQILEVSRRRTDTIKARTKLELQAQAVLRRMLSGDKGAAKAGWSDALKDEDHHLRRFVEPFIQAIDIFREQQEEHEKTMVKAVKGLPIYEWAKSTKGFGDKSLAIIIGECTGLYNKDMNGHLEGDFFSIGEFKSVSALWKRMGMAVLGGHRQGNPGQGATAQDWIAEGYSKTKRSVMWNIGNSLILSMGKFRPLFGEDVNANPDYTYFQRVFAERARYEAQRLPHKDGTPIKESATGKESYTLHAANRAKRYVEKRLLRMLFAEWRRCMG